MDVQTEVNVVALQQQLIDAQQKLLEAQREIISLQKIVRKMTPKHVKDTDVFWHLNSDGVSSLAAANSDDLLTVNQFQKWITDFAKKQIKPYVNPKVYGECLSQMTRGLPERSATLQTKAQLQAINSGVKASVALLRYGR